MSLNTTSEALKAYIETLQPTILVNNSRMIEYKVGTTVITLFPVMGEFFIEYGSVCIHRTYVDDISSTDEIFKLIAEHIRLDALQTLYNQLK